MQSPHPTLYLNEKQYDADLKAGREGQPGLWRLNWLLPSWGSGYAERKREAQLKKKGSNG